jgi:hypothetical protein
VSRNTALTIRTLEKQLMQARLYPALVCVAALSCVALIGCESGPVSLGSMSDGGGVAGSAGSGGSAGQAGSSGAGAGGMGGTGGLPLAQECGASVCVDATECCSESCGLCTRAGECSAIDCTSATEHCDFQDCPGPAPLAPNHMCADGSLAGPVCERDTAGDCQWTLRDCPAEGSGEPCGTRGGSACPDPEYCRFSLRARCGESDAPGICSLPPGSCSAEEHWVCGCDGISYPNGCLAASQGVSVASVGKCDSEPTGSCGGVQCDAGEFCKRDGCLTHDGQCTTKPDACDLLFAPVCGCDHMPYGNECEAAMAGVTVASQGECDGSGGGDTCGGFVGAGCDKGEYCDLAAGDGCDVADGQGLCKPQPQFCTLEIDEVCGCDGNTYSNACAAAAAGVSVRATGSCSK